MYYSYCMLFDSNYLDKGLAAISSLISCNADVKIYVLAMDEKCFEILADLNIKRVFLIRLSDFENDELLETKKNRSRAEYCWTCTASLILYIIKTYREEVCTYIDADMFFYKNPDFLIDNMIKKGKSVLIIEHGFSKDWRYQTLVKQSGRFCVEFNAFRNTAEGMEVLSGWVEDTLRFCSSSEKENLGDQMYLTSWPDKYKCIEIAADPGAGTAPWNVNRYSGYSIKDGIFYVIEKSSSQVFPIIFYHFHDIKYLEDNKVDIGVFQRYWKTDDALIYQIYEEYLRRVNEIKEMLRERYDVYPLLQNHPAYLKEKCNLIGRIKKVFSRNLKENLLRLDYFLKRKIRGKKDLIYVK